MQLEIRPHNETIGACMGFFVRATSLQACINGIALADVAADDVHIHPLPGQQPNSIWGCLVRTAESIKPSQCGPHQPAHQLAPHLLTPALCKLWPAVTSSEIGELMLNRLHAWHPETGWVDLPAPLKLDAHVASWELATEGAAPPATGAFVPQTVRSFQIKEVPPDEALVNMADKAFPTREPLPDKKLSTREKIRLKLYQSILGKGGNEKTADGKPVADGEGSGAGKTGPLGKAFAGAAAALGALMPKAFDKLADRINRDFDDLRRRNQRKLDQLMEMFERDPLNALKHAIPLDNNHSNRGENEGELDLSKRWGSLDLSALGGWKTGGGGSIDLGDGYHTLMAKYRELATDLEQKKDYNKAAFIYLKLLNEPASAAGVLERGKQYTEAAAIYLKFCKDKVKAAHCYERARQLNQAIELYIEAKKHEPAGDLLRRVGKEEDALVQFHLRVEELLRDRQHLVAAGVAKDKIFDLDHCQEILLKGWQQGNQGQACLNRYFDNYESANAFSAALNEVYPAQVVGKRRNDFLSAMQRQYKQRPEMEERLRDIGYRLISELSARDKNIVSELKAFRPHDEMLKRDTVAFRAKKRTE